MERSSSFIQIKDKKYVLALTLVFTWGSLEDYLRGIIDGVNPEFALSDSKK